MIRFLFKQPQPRRFNYKPRFYDERKEQLNARIEAVRKEMDMEGGASSHEAMRSRLHSAWRVKSTQQARAKSNKNIFIIAGLLAFIAYLLLY